MVQGELFREESSISGLGNFERKKSFLSRHQITFSLDKTLLVLIAFLIIFALTYSFGVEHGKRSVEKSIESLLPSQGDTVSFNTAPVKESSGKTQDETVILVNQTGTETPLEAPGLYGASLTSAPIEPSEVQIPIEPITETPIEAKPKNAVPVVDLSKKGSYTIQLVTYAEEGQALNEINRLKSKGHDGFVIMSGKFYQVCANYFESKTKAKSFLKQFSDQSRYPDAYIRPVVR